MSALAVKPTIPTETRELRELLRELEQENAIRRFGRVIVLLVAFALLVLPFVLKDSNLAATSAAETARAGGWRFVNSGLPAVVGAAMIATTLLNWRGSLERRALTALVRAELKRSDPDWDPEA